MNAAYNRTLELLIRGGVVVLRTHADYLLAPKRAGYEPPRAARSTKLLSLRAHHWTLLLVALLQRLGDGLLLTDEVGLLRCRAALYLRTVLVDQGELLGGRGHAVASHLRHRRLLVL